MGVNPVFYAYVPKPMCQALRSCQCVDYYRVSYKSVIINYFLKKNNIFLLKSDFF